MSAWEGMVMDEKWVLRLSQSALAISHNFNIAFRENRNLFHCN